MSATATIRNQTCSFELRKAIGLSIHPRLISTLFTAPVELSTLNATEKTSTQLMKFGSVVTVCTNLRYGLHRISLRNTAKIIGNQLNAREIPLIANVLTSTRPTSASRTGLDQIYSNHFRPTKVSAEIGLGG